MRRVLSKRNNDILNMETLYRTKQERSLIVKDDKATWLRIQKSSLEAILKKNVDVAGDGVTVNIGAFTGSK